jgi:hypothetical protein
VGKLHDVVGRIVVLNCAVDVDGKAFGLGGLDGGLAVLKQMELLRRYRARDFLSGVAAKTQPKWTLMR